MGKDVIGMDRNIKEARENLNWLKRNFNFNGEFKLIEGDANRLTEYFDRVECVVTEPYMGPYFKKLPSVGKGKRVMRSLMQLYQGLFRELGKIVDGRVVIILPAIRTYKKVIGGDFLNIAEGNGFKLVKSRLVELPISYNNPRAKVLREIWVLQRAFSFSQKENPRTKEK